MAGTSGIKCKKNRSQIGKTLEFEGLAVDDADFVRPLSVRRCGVMGGFDDGGVQAGANNHDGGRSGVGKGIDHRYEEAAYDAILRNTPIGEKEML